MTKKNQGVSTQAATPLLSITISVYNHANYIEECLRSIAAQKVNFDYEVLIGEDCSTDESRNVLQRLEHELPSNFHFFYREHNMGAVANGEDLYARCRGRYLVDFEGDDFFLAPDKLQRQLDFLQSHPNYSAVYSNCLVVGADSEPNGEKYPECPSEDYDFQENFYGILPGQSGTLMCRTQEYFSARDAFMNLAEYSFYPGDRRNAFIFLCAGKVHCIQEPLSAYRHIKKGGSSYSATRKKNTAFAQNEVLFGKALYTYAQQFGSVEAQKWALLSYFRFRMKWSHGSRKVERLGTVLRDAHSYPRTITLITAQLRWYFGLLMRVLRGQSINL